MRIENIILTNREINNFLKRIETTRVSNQFLQLKNIVKGTLVNIPFNNLSLLTAKGRVPQSEEIVEFMLSGSGGLCNVMNTFLFILLRSLGYNVNFMVAKMNNRHCHIVLKVVLNGQSYLIDVGNGFPYFEPILFGNIDSNQCLVFRHKLMDYKVIYRYNRYYMLHDWGAKNNWKIDFSFNDTEIPYSDFNHMLKMQYNEVGWGPFLTSIQFRKWYDLGALILRNKLFWRPEKNARVKINSHIKLKRILDKHFKLNISESSLITAWNLYKTNHDKRYEKDYKY